MKDRGWIADWIPVRRLEIGITDLTFDSSHWMDVNEFLQIERDPSPGKTQARQSLALLLAQLTKWQIGLRPNSIWLDIPRVLAVPARDGTFKHIVMGRLSGTPGTSGASGLPLTLVVSEHEALPESFLGNSRGKVWGVAAGGDSSRWIQGNTWKYQRNTTALNKMIWASSVDRKQWLANENLKNDTKSQGLHVLNVNGIAQREAAKQIGAVWSSGLKSWVLCNFWDTWPSQEWIKGADARVANLPLWKRPNENKNIQSWKKDIGKPILQIPNDDVDYDQD